MLRTKKTRLAACSLLLALPLALSACGDSDDSPKSGGSSSAAAPSSTAPAETPSASTPSSTPPASDSSATGDGVGKPSKADVAAGLKKTYDNDPATKNTLDTQKFSTCMADKSYDTMSAKSLNSLKDGDITGLDPDDTIKMLQYTGPCAQDSVKSGATMPSGLPSDFPTSLPSGFPTTMPSMPSL